MTSNRKATLPERIRMVEIIKEHITKQDNGLFSYDKGWDDRRVAAIVNAQFTPRHAASVRIEVFGNLVKDSTKNQDLSSLTGRVERLEENVARLMQELGVTNDT